MYYSGWQITNRRLNWMVLTKSTSNRTAKLIFTQVSFSVLFIFIFCPYTLMLMKQLFLSFCADSIDNKTAAFSDMKCCIAIIHHWMLHDKLTFNDENTEFLLIGTCQSTISLSWYHQLWILCHLFCYCSM